MSEILETLGNTHVTEKSGFTGGSFDIGIGQHIREAPKIMEANNCSRAELLTFNCHGSLIAFALHAGSRSLSRDCNTTMPNLAPPRTKHIVCFSATDRRRRALQTDPRAAQSPPRATSALYPAAKLATRSAFHPPRPLPCYRNLSRQT